MRQGEIFGLAVRDIDEATGYVHVRRQVKLIGSRRVFAPHKGGKARDVPLSPKVLEAILAHLKARPARDVTLPWAKVDGKPTTEKLIFTSRESKALNRNYFNPYIWKPALAEAGVIETPEEGELFGESRADGMHALRHHYASVTLDGGENIRALSEYLGHADPGFTLRVYTHLMPGSAARTRKAVDHALGAAVDGLVLRGSALPVPSESV
ncbi:tyrosine-type recombinase/integrase [Embleya sp. NBC_00888]|uniref:tyrosine-type recombinase/integrase n=1 Tax=Embleya sp. NBC_00888 TaxID=2975960 RepID=UPI00386A0014